MTGRNSLTSGSGRSSRGGLKGAASTFADQCIVISAKLSSSSAATPLKLPSSARMARPSMWSRMMNLSLPCSVRSTGRRPGVRPPRRRAGQRGGRDGQARARGSGPRGRRRQWKFRSQSFSWRTSHAAFGAARSGLRETPSPSSSAYR